VARRLPRHPRRLGQQIHLGKDGWSDVSSNNPKVDGRDGAGTLNAEKAVLIAKSRIIGDDVEVDSQERGWDVKNANDPWFSPTDGNTTSRSRFRYFARLPPPVVTSPLSSLFTYHLKSRILLVREIHHRPWLQHRKRPRRTRRHRLRRARPSGLGQPGQASRLLGLIGS
jgi:hypothetical protein